MFRNLRLKSRPETVTSVTGSINVEWLNQNESTPVQLAQINQLPDGVKGRLYRNLIPSKLLVDFGIDPISWSGSSGNETVRLKALPESGTVQISIRLSNHAYDECFHLEIADNAFNTVDLNFLILNDPNSTRYNIDFDQEGNSTGFGSIRRNLDEELKAMQAGLAPAQVRSGLGASSQVLNQLEAFLAVLGQKAFFLEPLTYASAWIFEKRGFAYVRGHKLMDSIQTEFQPGGQLYAALDSSSPFRKPEHCQTVRGRAWAIHDGILEVLDARWDKLRMVKQLGRHAGVNTFPGAVY